MTLHFNKVQWLVLCAWILSITNGFSETIILQLRNGDRLTGALISENASQVVISNSWAKELTVPVSEISKREKVLPMVEAVTPKIQTNAVAVAKPSEESKSKPQILRAKSWHGKIDIGMDLGFNEKNRQLFYGTAKVVYAPEKVPDEIRTVAQRFKNTFDYQATYGRTAGILSANRMDGSSKTDFDLHKGLFVYNLFSLGYDEIRAIDFQYEIGPGVGYHIIARSNLTLNAEIGLSYQAQNFQNNIWNERFFLRFAEDFTWRITKKLTWEEKLELLPSLDSFRSFRFRLESNLRYAFWQNFSFVLSVLDIYDTKPAPGIGKNDLQVRSMIGVNF